MAVYDPFGGVSPSIPFPTSMPITRRTTRVFFDATGNRVTQPVPPSADTTEVSTGYTKHPALPGGRRHMNRAYGKRRR